MGLGRAQYDNPQRPISTGNRPRAKRETSDDRF